MSGPLGDNFLNLPFEAGPPGQELVLDGASLAGGVVIIAGMLPVEGTDGLRQRPCLIYRFAAPDGTFYPPIVLCTDDGQMGNITTLTAEAATAALTAARSTG